MPVLQTDLRKTPAHGLPRAGYTLRRHRIFGRPRFAEPQQNGTDAEFLFPSQLDWIGHNGAVRNTGGFLSGEDGIKLHLVCGNSLERNLFLMSFHCWIVYFLFLFN